MPWLLLPLAAHIAHATPAGSVEVVELLADPDSFASDGEAIRISHPYAAENTSFGVQLTALQDVDGDGFPELAFGWSGEIDDLDAQPPIWWLDTSASGIAVGTDGWLRSDYDHRNYSVFDLGDLDGDGFPDAGVASSEIYGSRGGQLQLHYGTGHGLAETPEVVLHAAAYDAPDDYYGGQAKGADIDGDGLRDLVVTDSSGDDGTLYSYWGADGRAPEAGEVVIDGGEIQANNGLGRRLLILDVDGDAYADVVLSGDRGLSLLPGSASGLSADTALSWSSDDPTDFQPSPADAGELDGLPGNELAVGLPYVDHPTADIVHVGMVLFLCPTPEAIEECEHDRLWPLEPFEDYRLGALLLGGADLDGDGVEDLVAGTYHHDSSARGRVVVWLGSEDGYDPDAPITLQPGDGSPDDQFGSYSLAAVPDTDDDGGQELLVGASGHDGDGFEAGAAYLLRWNHSSGSDGGAEDGGAEDGGAADGGASDGGDSDGGDSDGGDSDGGDSDGGDSDGGAADGGASDGGGGDAGATDGGSSDPLEGEDGKGCSTAPGPGALLTLALLGLPLYARRRRLERPHPRTRPSTASQP